MKKNNLLPIAQGVLRSTILTVILLLIFTLITTFSQINDKVSNVLIAIMVVISIIYGTIYAVRKIGKKGWIIGICVGTIYILIMYLVSVISGAPCKFDKNIIGIMVIALASGALSGMLGINI